MNSHDAIHKQASYFILEFDVPSSALAPFNNYLSRDIDIIKRTIFKVPEITPQPACTLHEELKPPAYRLVKTFKSLLNMNNKCTIGILFLGLKSKK